MDNRTIKTNFKDAKSLRKVVEFILMRDLKKIKNKRVLEIGCGNWDFAKKILEKNNNEWVGLEPVDLGMQNMTFIKGSVKKMPFHNNSFDYVLCNQTMEHWFEYSVSLKGALKEINRVLEPKGVLIINAPIHVHGDPRFLRGELKKIRKSFDNKLWKITLFEKCFPSVKTQRWKKIAGKGFFSKIGYPDFLIRNPSESWSYIINIHAKKKAITIPAKKKKKFLRYFSVILRFFKIFIKTRFTYD